MDEDLSKTLEQLEAKKKKINAEHDLNKECESIVEFDRRIGLLLNEFKILRASIDEQVSAAQNAYDKLESAHSELKRTSQMFDLISQLIQLNRICRRIDNIEAFSSPKDYLKNINRRLSSNGEVGVDNEHNEGGEHSFRTVAILEIITTFETLYQPLESGLAKRTNLPYVGYAKKVRSLKEVIDSSCVSDLGETAGEVT